MVRESVTVERGLRRLVERAEQERDVTLGEAGGYLIDRGLEVRRAGMEPSIEGPFGVSRPFSKVSLSGNGPKTEVSVVLADGTVEQARDVFEERTDTENLRRAMRLGAISEYSQEFKVEGKAGVISRPFADVGVGK